MHICDRPERAACWAMLLALTGLLAGCVQPSPDGQTVTLDQPVLPAAWSFGDLPGRRLTSRHYAIYTTSRRYGASDGLARFMEAARTHYAVLTSLPQTLEGEQRWDIYLLADRQQWEQLTLRIAGPQAPLYLRVQSGGYCFAGVCVFWDISPMVTYVISAHEGMHQFLHHRTRHSLPAWAEEGLATMAEGFNFPLGDRAVRFDPSSNPMRYKDLRRSLLAGRLRGVSELAAMDAGENAAGTTERAVEYYGQLWALLLLIDQDPRYRVGLRRLIADAAAGRLREGLNFSVPEWNVLIRDAARYNRVVGQRALASYIDADLDRLQSRYEAFARTLAGLN